MWIHVKKEVCVGRLRKLLHVLDEEFVEHVVSLVHVENDAGERLAENAAERVDSE